MKLTTLHLPISESYFGGPYRFPHTFHTRSQATCGHEQMYCHKPGELHGHRAAKGVGKPTKVIQKRKKPVDRQGNSPASPK